MDFDNFENRQLSRREFMQQAGMFSLGMLALGLPGWFTRSLAATPNSHRMVIIMLRGAVDGLSVVTPYSDPNYYQYRPQIAIPRPGADGGLLNLDNRFGLNPNLDALMPFWQNRSLAFVHASGSPDNTRSHFDAQDFMESGTPGNKHTGDGWMNRLLTQLPSTHSPTQAVSFSNILPKIFRGPASVANMAVGAQGQQPMPLDRPQISAVFDKLYAGNDALSLAYKEGIAARRSLLEDLNSEMQMADNGAQSPKGFAQATRKLADVMVKDPSIQLVFTDVGGWDTHVNQGASQGQLAGKLKSLGDGVGTLLSGLQKVYPNTTVVVMSEFGRTAHENGNVGTDHGHGNVMWVAGGNIQGGKVYGDWPGLAPEALYEGRDLAITTDFRSVISYVLGNQFALTQPQLQKIFPAFTPAWSNLKGLVRA